MTTDELMESMEIPQSHTHQAAQELVEASSSNSTQADPTKYLKKIEAFYDSYAAEIDRWHRKNRVYHQAIARVARHYVPPGARVLEVGSGNGDLLASLEPAKGLGIDASAAMVRLSAMKYPHLRFEHMNAERIVISDEKFDYIIMSDLIGTLYDIRLVFEQLRRVCHRGTRLIVHWYSRVWQPAFTVAQWLKLKHPEPMTNWTTIEDIANLLYLADSEVVGRRQHILLPQQLPFLTTLANRYLANMPILRWLCLTNWVVARPLGMVPSSAVPSVSVICPCRNESGTIDQIVRRLPEMGSHTELVFVEGHSADDTLEQCRRAARKYPDKDIKVLVQEGIGKGDAVRQGFANAQGDVLMILDADLGVAPEDLPQFYDTLVSGRGEFVNGSRLVYDMDDHAMRFLNIVGNRIFARLLSNLLGQPIKDTLCGLMRMRLGNLHRFH